METMIEMGKISSRGQVAIPSDIRNLMGLEEGTKILFFAEEDMLFIKKVTDQTFSQITMPLKAAFKRSRMKEKDVPDIVHRFRKKKER